MTGDEARRRLAASTRFEIRAGLVWLRELRWGRAAVDAVPGTRADACRTVRLGGPRCAARVERSVDHAPIAEHGS